MNAYELADLLMAKKNIFDKPRNTDAANMLRQQADRIAELEKDLHMLQRHYDQLDHDLPNAEPVAWLARNQLIKKYIPISLEEKEKFLPHVLQLYDDWIPLYTTPQTKPLTAEEIFKIVNKIEQYKPHLGWQLSNEFNILEFVLAIEERILGK